MKPLLIAFTLFSSVFAKTTFAQQNPITPAVLHTFNLSYSKATNVKWSEVDNMYKAEFMLNDQSSSIFYSKDGAVIATSRFIVPSQLPIQLQASLEKNYKNYKLTGLFEVVNEEGSNFYAVMENTKTILTLKGYDNQEWRLHIKKRR
jgi:hypothetical protein